MVGKRKEPWKELRELAVFALGAGGAAHDIFLTNGADPARLAFFAMLMGLGVYLRSNGR